MGYGLPLLLMCLSLCVQDISSRDIYKHYTFSILDYQFGVRLTNGLDGKTLITFNARNDHDRQKFVGDLKEAIQEVEILTRTS